MIGPMLKCKLCCCQFEQLHVKQAYCSVRCQVRKFRRNASKLQRERYAALKAAGASVQVANIASKSSGRFDRAIAAAREQNSVMETREVEDVGAAAE